MAFYNLLSLGGAWQSRVRMVLAISVIGAVLSGCATTGQALGDAEFPAAMELSNVKVAELLAADKGSEAVTLLSTVARDNPGRKEPWLRLARLHFDAEDYGNAIVASDEVIKRDGTDRTAKSIRAVAGLRVAAASVTELRNDADLKGSAQADAIALAKELRETLGETVLFPQAAPEVKASEEPDASARVERKATKSRRARSVPAKAASRSPGQSINGDPFSVLR